LVTPKARAKFIQRTGNRSERGAYVCLWSERERECTPSSPKREGEIKRDRENKIKRERRGEIKREGGGERDVEYAY
jgi:hypothetical protein